MKIETILLSKAVAYKLESKHGVSEEELRSVLLGKPHVRFVCLGHVEGEDVYLAMGCSDEGRTLIVYFINKGRGAVRPISARDMTKTERRLYEKTRHG